MSRWHPRAWRRRPVTTAAAVVTVPAIVLTLALVDRGFPLARVDLNDGGVWLTATSQLSLGRYNVPVEELDGGLVTTGGTFDVLQDEGAVLLVEPTALAVVDPASVATTTQVATGGADVSMAAGRVALVDAAGDLWVRDVDGLDGLVLDDDTPDAQLGEGGAAVVARSGTVLGVAPADGAVVRVPAVSTVVPEEAGSLGAVEVDAVTAVGDELVVLSGSTVRTLRGEVTVDDEDLVLQQPGPASDVVLAASRDALWEVPLDGGEPRRHETTGTGAPAAPVRVAECAYGAWASTLGSSLRLCDGREPVVEDLEGMTAGDLLAFRVNRGFVVLNETAGGRVWLPQQDTQVRVPNWEDIVPEEDPDQAEDDSDSGEVTQEPVTECTEQSAAPVAVDDEYGVRAGRSRVLPVLDNDSSSDCGILVISELDTLPADFGTVETVRGGRALQVHVLEGAAGTAEVRYTVTDGRGVNAPSTATVRLTVGDQDTPPQQVRTSSLTVETGGQVVHGVLADFVDPDGDDLLLVGAIADPAAGTARFRQDGVLTFAADGGSLGRTTVQVLVSDGTNVVEGEVVVDVRAAGSVPPQIDPVHAVTYVGQEVVVRPLDAVRSASAEPPRLAAVTDAVGATIVPDLTAGTFSFKAARAGSYYVTFVVTAAPQQATGVARVDVREWPEQALPPIAVRDLALLPAGGVVTIDPLANDEDPANNVLVLQSVTAPEGSGLQVAVLEHRYVQIRADRTPDGPVVLTYEVSNGSASARGEIVVQPVPPAASSQPPVVPNVEATVRAGGVVTIPVLERASDPDGDTLTVLRDLPEPLAEGDGLLFVSGDVLRYQAPDRALTARATFAVSDSAGNVTAATVTVRVHESDAATKSPPRPRDIEARVFDGDTVRIPVPLVGIDTDGDGVTLLGQASALTLGRVVDFGADWIEYEADPGARGTDTFTYAVEDWVGQRAVAKVRVGIAARPSTASGVVAVDDAVTLRPGQRIEVRVLANDIDSTGRELTLDSIVVPDGVDARIQGRRIVVTAPSTPQVVPIEYLVVNDAGGRDYGLLTVTVTDDAPVEPPIARDVRVPAIETLGKTEVAVDVLAVAQNPSGPLADLEVQVPASHASAARVTADGDVVVTLAESGQTVPYRLVNRTDPAADAYAFITVPPLGFFPPQLRPRAPELRVASGEELRIPLAEHVQVAPGREPSIADPTQVTATRSDGAELVADRSTLVFRSADGYAGPASITVPVSDATGAGDTTARTSLLTLLITVYAVDDYPPDVPGRAGRGRAGCRRHARRPAELHHRARAAGRLGRDAALRVPARVQRARRLLRVARRVDAQRRGRRDDAQGSRRAPRPAAHVRAVGRHGRRDRPAGHREHAADRDGPGPRRHGRRPGAGPDRAGARRVVQPVRRPRPADRGRCRRRDRRGRQRERELERRHRATRPGLRRADGRALSRARRHRGPRARGRGPDHRQGLRRAGRSRAPARRGGARPHGRAVVDRARQPGRADHAVPAHRASGWSGEGVREHDLHVRHPDERYRVHLHGRGLQPRRVVGGVARVGARAPRRGAGHAGRAAPGLRQPRGDRDVGRPAVQRLGHHRLHARDQPRTGVGRRHPDHVRHDLHVREPAERRRVRRARARPEPRARAERVEPVVRHRGAGRGPRCAERSRRRAREHAAGRADQRHVG